MDWLTISLSKGYNLRHTLFNRKSRILRSAFTQPGQIVLTFIHIRNESMESITTESLSFEQFINRILKYERFILEAFSKII